MAKHGVRAITSRRKHGIWRNMAELYPILMLFYYKAFRQQFRHLSEYGGIVRDAD
jgi:hypothetical protein